MGRSAAPPTAPVMRATSARSESAIDGQRSHLDSFSASRWAAYSAWKRYVWRATLTAFLGLRGHLAIVETRPMAGRRRVSPGPRTMPGTTRLQSPLRWQLARGADGKPQLWMARRKRPGRGERRSGPGYDVMKRS